VSYDILNGLVKRIKILAGGDRVFDYRDKPAG
jgi:hypothetical protein